ncbi:MAG: bifunctional 2-polyprenyl-6-hydroxyphenol methylase/3-demethylubiquinol 3-O-methyltransferase UbiG [Rhodospirillales bacterium]
MPAPAMPAAANIDANEVRRFERLAAQWWDADGPMGQLHAMNGPRMGFIREHASAALGLAGAKDGAAARLFAGLKALDVGCGAGVASEPLARLGAAVTAIDAAKETIAAAKAHAKAQELTIDYRVSAVEDLPKGVSGFDIVTVLELVEHVPDPAALIACAAARLRPGGVMVLSTLNRTFKSLALAKAAAEYVLRWVPPGTHDWRAFVRPSELDAYVRAAGLRVTAVEGLTYSLPTGEWRRSGNVSMNYLMAASSPATSA